MTINFPLLRVQLRRRTVERQSDRRVVVADKNAARLGNDLAG
jgi:hypothetical protein